ncbi:ABC transporter permease [Umezawaea endophytica]|uniref:ABC transporter permease subunit n=1 Tax=Umezawaea endophytica TaxID=1654476 RepID=A0A9X3AE43_9PSEU|nr:ABC transporter permease subunit [Umezawaea endophytica]MCS7476867.1 ABC transporter permease subunit [Umezawaea endophytica]
MIWVSWRRQRPQLITLLAMLVVGAGVVVLLRSSMLDSITSSGLTECVTRTTQECSTNKSAGDFRAEWSTRLQLGQAAIIFLPVLIGLFIGAPLFARELEQGTHVLAFTQSVSRTRWMLSKLVVALVPALVVLIALQYLVWWWLTTAGVMGPRVNGSFQVFNFGIEHVSPVAYTLFAFAVGAFVGVVTRRTLVAMIVTLGAFTVLRFALFDVVTRVMTTQREVVTSGLSPTASRDASLVISQGYLDAAGQPIAPDKVGAAVQACKATWTPEGQQEYVACLAKSDLGRRYADFIPESQAWQAHLVDASIYGALAVLLLVGTGWALRRQS